MKQITVLNPNITTVKQNRLGLSTFGLLSRLFTLELAGRVHQEEGMWQALALELLEDGENEDQPHPVSEIQLNLDLKILTKALREELARQSEHKPEEKNRKEKKETEKKPAALTTEQRVLERILLRERELRETSVTRLLTHGNFGQRELPKEAGTVTVLRGERYAILRERREAPRRTIAVHPFQNQRPDIREPHPSGQKQIFPASYEQGMAAPSAAQEARAALRPGAAAAAGYRASRIGVPFRTMVSGPAFSGLSAEMAPLSHKEDAEMSSVLRAGDTAGGLFNHSAALRQFESPAELFFPNSGSGESRAEALGSESPVRSVQLPLQSATIPARAAQNMAQGSRQQRAQTEAEGALPPGDSVRDREQRGAATGASLQASPRDQTSALRRQQETAAKTIRTLSRIQAQKESQRTQGRAHHTLSEASEGTASTPGATERVPIARANLVLASQATTIPYGEGWAPQWQPEHPGYAAETPERAKVSGGSILFPDLLRYRREQAVSGNAPRGENRVPVALSAVLKDAANRERIAHIVPVEQPDGRHALEQAVRQEDLIGTTQRNASHQQETQKTEQQSAFQSAPTVSQAVTESRNAAKQHTEDTSTEAERALRAHQPDRAGTSAGAERAQTSPQYVDSERTSEAEREQAAQQFNDANASAETEQHAAQAVPVADAAAPTVFPVSGELAYKIEGQSDLQTGQPTGQRAERQSAFQSAPTASQPAAERRAATAQQRHAADTLTGTERALRAHQPDRAGTSAGAERAQTSPQHVDSERTSETEREQTAQQFNDADASAETEQHAAQAVQVIFLFRLPFFINHLLVPAFEDALG